MSEDVRDLLRRDVEPGEYDEIRGLWKRHSIAEDERDLPGLISTLTDDCVTSTFFAPISLTTPSLPTVTVAPPLSVLTSSL